MADTSHVSPRTQSSAPAFLLETDLPLTRTSLRTATAQLHTQQLKHVIKVPGEVGFVFSWSCKKETRSASTGAWKLICFLSLPRVTVRVSDAEAIKSGNSRHEMN